MKTIRLTTSQAIIKYLMAQKIIINNAPKPLFAGVFAIFGHGNVTCLGTALEEVKEDFPTWRGQNEQGMALAATAYAKASKRRQIMVATSSVGPGATNMVTSASVAMANRMPLLLLAGDTFQSRISDPVLQQVEHFGDPSTTVNDSFRAVVRYWDRITHPAQVVHSLPHATNTMLDPADCGPAFIGLPQDIAADAYDYPLRCFDETIHEIRRPRPDRIELERAATLLRKAKKPLIISGGGVHWSDAEAELAKFVEAHNIPVVETVAGRTSLTQSHRLHAGIIGVSGCTSANALAAQADLVLAVGTRLGDFTTGSWTVFSNEALKIITVNTARFDATKHLAVPLVADAREALAELSKAVATYRCEESWSTTCALEAAQYHAYIDKLAAPTGPSAATKSATRPTYAQVVGVVDRASDERSYALSAAGGFPGELVNGWRSDTVHSFDIEYGYSCMGYEISGGWGAKMALPDRDVVVFVGDGSYMMMNSDLYSSVLSGHKLIVIVCDNGGFAVINRLQVNQGGVPFNNLISDSKVVEEARVDFAAHAASMGAKSETVASIAELTEAYQRAKASDRTYVIVLATSAYDWTEGGAWWEVGVPEVSGRQEIRDARAELDVAKAAQRVGW